MNKTAITRLNPLDLSGGKKTDITDFPNINKIINIAERRTHRFALECVRPSYSITLKEALAGAYLQGMNDTVLLQDKELK